MQRDAQEYWRAAKAAYEAGAQADARRLLLRYVALEEHNETAWIWLGELMLTIEDQIVALENVLTLNRGNLDAARRLEYLKWVQADRLLLAAYYEERGHTDLAEQIYRRTLMQSQSPAERREAAQRLANIDWRVRHAHIKRLRPTLAILRLATGVPLFYFLLVWLHTGFSPFSHNPWLFWGLPFVALGAILIGFANQRPRHRLWLAWFWQGGNREERLTTIAVRTLGLLLIWLPYALLFADAGARLRGVWSYIP